MAVLDRIAERFDNYLNIKEFSDVSYNGLQFQGRREVRKIMYTVDAGVETFKRGAEIKADMIVVHHGLFWKGVDPSLRAGNRKRIEILFDNEISLYASHLPLDRHRECGNNASIHRIIGTDITGDFGWHNGQAIGYTGRYPSGVSIERIVKRLETELQTRCRLLPFGKREIGTVGVVSGGGSIGDLSEAVDKGLDLFITGEPTEIYHLAKDEGINVIFAGHHASEKTGLVSLMKQMRTEFSNVTMVFEDIPTGI